MSHLLLHCSFRYLKFVLPIAFDILHENVSYICLKEQKLAIYQLSLREMGI